MSVSGAQLGRYTIVRKLARGGMADLLLARTNGVGGFERHVVIKRLRDEQARDPQCVKMFVDEARLAGALHHHNIIQVQDVGDEGGRPYFAMEYVHGEDLRTMLKRLRDLGEVPPLQHVVAIIASAATALHHAHEQRGPDRQPLGIVHRDVSPSNVLVGYDGNVKVLDFGIAKTAMQTEHTQVGTLKGKVPYMSPEQCTGKDIDRRSDVFSLSIVAYELCCVRRLFKGETDFLTMSAIVHGNLPRPTQFRRDLPSGLEKIILKGLAREPEDRYQSADELRVALDTFAAKAGMVATASGLVAYMKQLFGERHEPWHVVSDDAVQQDADIDFDGGLAGVAEPPTDVQQLTLLSSAAATSESPIVKAKRATTNVPQIAAEEETTDVQAVVLTPTAAVVVQPTQNLEVRFSAPKPALASAEPPMASQVDVAGTIIPVERPSTNTDVGPSIAIAPPPDPAIVEERPKPDPNTTLVVDPLDLEEQPPPNQKIWIIGGLAGAGVIAVAMFVWFAFVKPSAADAVQQPIDLSAGHRDTTPTPTPTPEPTPPAPDPTPPVAEQTKPVEPPQAPPQPASDPTPAPPDPTPTVAERPPSPEIEMEATATKPPSSTAAASKTPKPAVRIKRPPAPPRPPQQQTTTTATTTAKPPAWDPDALFPKKKKP